jgi:hypothetical protein
MLPKTRIDKLTWLILNHVISVFGLRMKEHVLVYMYKLPPDGCTNILKTDRTLKGGDMHIISITTDLNEVFRFCGLDRNEYEKGFLGWFEYSSWIMTNCKYMTRVIIGSLQNGIETDSMKADPDLLNDMKKFLLYVRLSHTEVKDNELYPALFYYNIKEDIVRNFFWDEELEERFASVKKRCLFKNELEGKFTSELLVRWMPELKDDPDLINMFGKAFITFATNGKVERFPKYLVDSEKAEIRRDAQTFYSQVFQQSEEYKLYVIEHETDGPPDE